MKPVSRTWVAVLALTCLTIAATPCLAGDSPASAKDAKVPVIRVVIDHEKHLALIPEGTVLPAGLQITSSVGMSDEALDAAARTPESERPLVFAYAPAERFAGVEPRPDVASENGETFELRGTDVPEPKTVSAGNPCPTLIVVEFGPEIFQQVDCAYEVNVIGQQLESFWAYLHFPTDARNVVFTRLVDYPAPIPDSEWTTTCSIPSGSCRMQRSTFLEPVLTGTYYVSKARVRLSGASGPEQPDPLIFLNTIRLPVLDR